MGTSFAACDATLWTGSRCSSVSDGYGAICPGAFAVGLWFAFCCSYIDPEEELVWVGNDHGYVLSYIGTSLNKYTAFKVPGKLYHGIARMLPTSPISSPFTSQLLCCVV